MLTSMLSKKSSCLNMHAFYLLDFILLREVRTALSLLSLSDTILDRFCIKHAKLSEDVSNFNRIGSFFVILPSINK